MLKIIKLENIPTGNSPWRLVTDDGREVWAQVPFNHDQLGPTLIDHPVCGKTKTECIEKCLALLETAYQRIDTLNEKLKQAREGTAP